jgi:hypothetical protein
VEQAHALQDAIKVNQNSPGRFEVPNWDQASRKKVHDAILTLGETISSSRSYGTKDQVDPVPHLIGTARGWGGLPERDAFYLGVTPSKNDGITTHRLNVKDVPVDAFWSVSVYNAEGYFEPNQFNAYSLNNITATKSGHFRPCRMLLCAITRPGGIFSGIPDKYRMSIVSSRCARLPLIVGSSGCCPRRYASAEPRSCFLRPNCCWIAPPRAEPPAQTPRPPLRCKGPATKGWLGGS